MCVILVKTYIWDLSGETFLRKGSPPPPLPKTFNPNFSKQDAPCKMYRGRFLLCRASCLEKFKLEVLGKEFEEEPFFKRVFLNKLSQILLYEYRI